MNNHTIGELWRYRELLYFLAWRDVKVRYRQAALGVAWAVFQPLLTMVIFTVFFGRMAHMPSDGLPYPLFSYCGLVPWMYFSGVLAMAGNSLISNSTLITKVYFPRLLLPTSVAVAGLLDFGMSAGFLVIMMFYYRVPPRWLLLTTPFWIAMLVMVTTGISMLVAAVNVKYRDVKYLLPFGIQILLFATPIIYPVTLVPQRYRYLLALNPCWGMIDGFRASIFPGRPIDLGIVGVSVTVGVGLFVAGVYYFRKAERSFADVI